MPASAGNAQPSTPQTPITPSAQRWGSPNRSETRIDAPSLSDPFTLIVMELVRLIQAALALWGFFGADREELEVDGLFCDDTKNGIFAWRRSMGMEHEESLKLEVRDFLAAHSLPSPRSSLGVEGNIGRMHRPKDALGTAKFRDEHQIPLGDSRRGEGAIRR